MADLIQFISGFKSVSLATVDEEGAPFASYAPFVRHEKRYYIFISDIARHSRNLRRDPRAALLFVEDESACDNIFTRKRAVLRCDSRLLEREDPFFESVLGTFKTRFDPDMLDMLLRMKDFNLFELTPCSGEAVFGFGQAYDIVGEFTDQLASRRGNGHATETEK